MKTRIIAVVLASSLFWSSVPLALAFSTREGVPPAVHQSSAAQDHSCCPGIHLALPVQLFLRPLQEPMPCSEQHPCCARPGHENPASLPATTRGTRSFVEITVAVLECSPRPVLLGTSRIDGSFSPPYCQRSTILRI